MPLVRVEVRNEYALGAPELWREANKEDPKEVLEGVAVAGLVGVLRQLGDLAEFAAEVFHGLQEEVSVTFSRSHKLMARVQRIEVALPPLEKAVLAQRSHLHFAYTAGSNWHTRIRCKQNHFVYSDVSDFIMDSYEDSRDPPRLHLLDRFDPGGPGSCLRRYSDPTFFKRASGAYAEASTGKTAKDKGRKIKKRSSWSRYGGASCGTSFSYHSGRVRFTERSVGEHASPTQTIFTEEPTLRSDWGEESNPDLRNRSSGYIGGDFCPSYSTQQELESRVSISSSIKRRDSDFLDYNFIEGNITDACDDNHVNRSLEQAGCGSSSVTGDEKNETLEPKMQDCDPYILQENNHNQESLPQIFETGTMDNTAVILENGDIHLVDVGTASITENCDLETIVDTVNLETGDVHLEDIESETDDFEDALNNIIESESETDTELTKKQEVEHYDKLEDEAVHYVGQSELIRCDYESSNSESNFQANSSLVNGNFDYHNPSVTSLPSLAAHGSINETEDNNELNLVNLVDEALLSAQRARELSFDSHENNRIDDDPNVESVSPTGLFNFIGAISERPIIDGTRSSPEFPKPGPETVNVASSTTWTNGGLLGLQPSKPPDLSGSKAPSQDNVTKKDKITRRPYQTENQEIEEGPNMVTRMDQNYQESVTLFRKPTWKLSPADLDVKLGKPGDSRYPHTTSFTGARVMTPGSVPANSAFQAVRKNEESCSSSRMLELSNRLFTTGSNLKLLPCENGNANGLKNLENDAYQKIFGRTKDLLGVDSIMDSPSSSPPLQHMKILLQPIDGFETSKLKMKFSDGNPNNGSGRDIFPSFQLVPEAYITRRDIGSDSDDDTFCRSSPSLSDDCESHRSASNSEIWESGESARSKDHELYDALQRISLTESVSTLPENGNSIHGLQFPFENSINSQSRRSYDIQSLDSLNHSFRDDIRIYTNLMNVGEPQTEPSPAPPPLPPVQWRGADLIEDKCAAKHEGRNYTFDVKHSESTISQQPKPAPFNHDQVFETIKMQKSKTFSSRKSNGQREANQGKGMDEKEDFLQQIRTKSFNLRPIDSAKMMTPSGGSANVQVTAILEKANAIRQAVGSDDGEDDSNWSDT